MWRLWTRGWGPRDWWYWFKHEGLPFFIARQLPRKVAYWAFIRVHAAGEVHWAFNEVATNWESSKRALPPPPVERCNGRLLNADMRCFRELGHQGGHHYSNYHR